jgi:hypothetical protein
VEQELQMVQLSANKCSCVAILSVSLVSFAAITLCVASHRVFIVLVVYFVIESVPKLLDTPSYVNMQGPERLWGHLTSYPLGKRGSFPGSKAVEMYSWP